MNRKMKQKVLLDDFSVSDIQNVSFVFGLRRRADCIKPRTDPFIYTAIRKMIRIHSKSALGWKLSGAGGGGYLVLVSQEPVPGAIQLKFRRPGEG
jgi:hypothetical protein